MEQTLYIVTAEIVGPKDSRLVEETSSTHGHVHAFVTAQDALEAGIKVKLALEKSGYDVTGLEEIINALYFEFDEDVEEENTQLMTEAIETGTVVLGAFYSGEDELDGKFSKNQH